MASPDNKKGEYKLPDRLTIPKVKRLSFPRKLVFLDTESVKVSAGGRMIRHDLRLGHAIFWQRASKGRKEKIEHYAYTNEFDLWQWLAGKVNKRETVYIFAHNLSFDFLVLNGFRHLPNLDFTLQSIYHKFTTTIMRFANEKRRLVFADTMNYFPVKLEELGKSVGIEKGKVDFETVTAAELAAYCKTDTEIVYKSIRQMIETLHDNDLAPFRLSAPSLAHAVYRHKFMKHRIITQHWDKVVDFEKNAYSGGYVNVANLLGRDRSEVVKLDVNSMYPSVMHEQDFPLYLVEFAGAVSLRILESFLRRNLVIARVTLSARDPRYLMRYPSGYCYPTGIFETTLTTPLLRRALANDEIIEVHQIAVYEKAPIFREFIAFMYAARQKALMDGDKANALFYKKMANSLYGKFGQAGTRVVRAGDAPPDEFAFYDAIDAQTQEQWRELHAGGSVLFIHQEREARYSFYAIAAHVVDYAKLKLFDLMERAGLEHVFYTDTDSIITNSAGLHNLRGELSETALGKMKIEASGLLFAGFSKKDYLIGGVRKLKGVPQVKTPPETNVFKMYQSSSIFGAARRQLSGGAFWHEVTRRHNPYLPNVSIDDVGRVYPLNMDTQADQLGNKVYTREQIRGLSNTMLTKAERSLLSPWLEI